MTTPGGPKGPTGPGGPTEPGGPSQHSPHEETTRHARQEGVIEKTSEHYHYPKTSPGYGTARVSWGGIFVGVFVTIAVGLGLLSLGAALGLSAVDPATAQMTAVGWGTGLWSILTVILATFVGAFVGVKVSNLGSSRDAGIQGFVVWSLSFLLVTFFAGSIAAAGAALALEVEAAAPVATIGEAASWGYFIGALLGAVAGALGGVAAYPSEMRAREERERREPVRREELRPSEA